MQSWKSNEAVHSHPAKDRPIGSLARCASIRCSRPHDPARAAGASVTFEPGARTRLAHPSARPDADRHGRLRLGAALRAGRSRKSGRATCLVPAGREALARRDGDHGHDAHRHSGSARRQGRRLDGAGQRRAVPELLSVEGADGMKLLAATIATLALMLRRRLSRRNWISSATARGHPTRDRPKPSPARCASIRCSRRRIRRARAAAPSPSSPVRARPGTPIRAARS